MLHENNSEDFMCINKALEELEDFSPSLTITVSVIQVLGSIIFLIGGVSLNLLVITLILRSKELRTPHFLLALQVVCFDLVIAVIFPVSLISTNIGGRWILGWHLCIINSFLLLLASFMRTVLVAILSVDRFLYVFKPHSYPKIHKCLFSISSVVVWVVALSFSSLALPGIFDCFSYIHPQRLCFTQAPCSSTVCRIYSGIYYFCIIFPAWILPAILYGCLYYKVKKIQRNMSENNNIRRQINNTAAITYFLILSTSVLLTFPSNILKAVVDAAAKPGAFHYILHGCGHLDGAAVVILDPIFLLRNESVKKELKRLLNALVRKRGSKTNS